MHRHHDGSSHTPRYAGYIAIVEFSAALACGAPIPAPAVLAYASAPARYTVVSVPVVLAYSSTSTRHAAVPDEKGHNLSLQKIALWHVQPDIVRAQEVAVAVAAHSARGRLAASPHFVNAFFLQTQCSRSEGARADGKWIILRFSARN